MAQTALMELVGELEDFYGALQGMTIGSRSSLTFFFQVRFRLYRLSVPFREAPF
jgi:hypothetical protein